MALQLNDNGTVMLRATKHLEAQRERPFATLRGTREPPGGQRNTVMLSAAKHLDAHPDRPFAAAQGDTVRQLRLMRIG